SWEPSSTPLVQYQIVRTRSAPSVSPKDGVLLATIAGLTYDDTTPEVGNPLYYTVFTDCEGIVSLQGATLNTSVLLTPNIVVENLTYIPTRTALHLQWRWPPRCEEVVVAYSYDGWPQQRRSPQEIVTRVKYEGKGHFALQGDLDRDYYITVTVV